VEDDGGMRESLSDLLAMKGAELCSADSAAQAIVLLQSFKPDLLISDAAMPGEDGYGLLRRIRALPVEQGRDTPAIALTALVSPDDQKAALDAGFQVHLSKPVDIERLLAAVVATLHSKKPPELNSH
jgi:CheY-like chemotaxis protein